MEYGLVEGSLDGIDFTLPRDTDLTLSVLTTQKPVEDIHIHVGAPKWGSKKWIGSLYPRIAKDRDFLRYYSRQFNTVEMSSTFYALPTEAQMNAWAEQIADRPDFQFCPKFPQQVTHIRKLKYSLDLTTEFYNLVDIMGEHCGPLMLQLPDSFKTKSYDDLESFLRALPTSQKVFVELRYKDWYANDEYRIKAVNLFRELNIGTVISDTAGRRDAVHMELSIPEVMIRFVGNDLAPSDYSRIDEWVERIKDWSSRGLTKLWFFVHTNDERYTPDLAGYLITRLNSELGTTLQAPTSI